MILGGNLSSTTTINLSAADYIFQGENPNTYAGYTVAAAGDVDGDGLSDILIAAIGEDSYAGAVYLILGSSIGNNNTISLANADYKFTGESAWDRAGEKGLSSAGDVDGDGLDDILIGAYQHSSNGATIGAGYLILGSSLGSTATVSLTDADYKFSGQINGDYAGREVAGAGDLDGDGLDDLLIGAAGERTNAHTAGAVYIVLGSSLGSTSNINLTVADYIFYGESAYDQAGNAVCSAGDVDGDGLSDLLIGSVGEDSGAIEAGAAYDLG